MIELILSAPASGSGKTVLACALLGALKGRGLNPCAFKCGPDYIDPMFHRAALGVDSHNLDLFLAEGDTVREQYRRYAGDRGAAVVEGAMGFYDGLGGSTHRASPWHAADTLELPVLLAVRPKGASLTLAAQIRGLLDFRQPSHIAAIFLTDCSPMLAGSLKPMLEGETGLPVLGHLPHLEEAELESRHLGLRTAGEIGDLPQRLRRAAETLEEAMDWERFFALFDRRPGWAAPPSRAGGGGVPLAGGRDEAVCFAYAVPGPRPGGGGRRELPHGGGAPRRWGAEGPLGAVRLCQPAGGGGQPAVPGGGDGPRPRVPLLGLHRQRGRSDRRQAPDGAELAVRLCERPSVRRLPPPVFRGPSRTGGAVCPGGEGVWRGADFP